MAKRKTRKPLLQQWEDDEIVILVADESAGPAFLQVNRLLKEVPGSRLSQIITDYKHPVYLVEVTPGMEFDGAILLSDYVGYWQGQGDRWSYKPARGDAKFVSPRDVETYVGSTPRGIEFHNLVKTIFKEKNPSSDSKLKRLLNPF